MPAKSPSPSKSRPASSSLTHKQILETIIEAWTAGIFLVLPLSQQLHILETLDSEATVCDPRVLKGAIELAWKKGFYLARDLKFQRGLINYLLKGT